MINWRDIIGIIEQSRTSGVDGIKVQLVRKCRDPDTYVLKIRGEGKKKNRGSTKEDVRKGGFIFQYLRQLSNRNQESDESLSPRSLYSALKLGANVILIGDFKTLGCVVIWNNYFPCQKQYLFLQWVTKYWLVS